MRLVITFLAAIILLQCGSENVVSIEDTNVLANEDTTHTINGFFFDSSIYTYEKVERETYAFDSILLTNVSAYSVYEFNVAQGGDSSRIQKYGRVEFDGNNRVNYVFYAGDSSLVFSSWFYMGDSCYLYKGYYGGSTALREVVRYPDAKTTLDSSYHQSGYLDYVRVRVGDYKDSSITTSYIHAVNGNVKQLDREKEVRKWINDGVYTTRGYRTSEVLDSLSGNFVSKNRYQWSHGEEYIYADSTSDSCSWVRKIVNDSVRISDTLLYVYEELIDSISEVSFARDSSGYTLIDSVYTYKNGSLVDVSYTTQLIRNFLDDICVDYAPPAPEVYWEIINEYSKDTGLLMRVYSIQRYVSPVYIVNTTNQESVISVDVREWRYEFNK